MRVLNFNAILLLTWPPKVLWKFEKPKDEHKGRGWGHRALLDEAGADYSVFKSWDAAMRRWFGPLAGLAFLKKTNTGGWVLVSRHWPHRLMWDWSLWFQPWRGTKQDGPARIGISRAFNQASLYLGLVSFTIHWQDTFGSVASKWRDEAPVVRFPWGGIGGGNIGRTEQERR